MDINISTVFLLKKKSNREFSVLFNLCEEYNTKAKCAQSLSHV